MRPSPPHAPLSVERNDRVLVVEDDTHLAELVARIVSGVAPGIAIDRAQDVRGARALLARDRYRLVLADYFLEGSQTGETLLTEARRCQANARIAMMSAMPFDEFLAMADARLPRDVQLLPKPFSALELRAFLFEMLDYGDDARPL